MFSTFHALKSNLRSINSPVYWPIANPVYEAFGAKLRPLTPCFTNMLAWYNGEVVDDNLKDVTPGRGTHQATKAVSLEFSGAQYGTLAETVTLVGDFTIKFSLKFTSAGSFQGFIGDSDYFVIDDTEKFRMRRAGSWWSFGGSPLITGNSYNVTISRIGSDVTIEYNSQQLTLTIDSDDFAISTIGLGSAYYCFCILWDIYAEDSTGVKFHNYLAQKSDTGWIESVVGPAVQLNGFTLPDDFTETSQYGHSWNTESYSEYVLADGITSGGHNVVGKIPEDPDNLGYDVAGEPLNRLGTARQDMGVTGYTGAWNGVAYAPLDSSMVLSGDFKIEFPCNITANSARILSGPSDYLRIDGTTRWLAKVNGAFVSFTDIKTNTGIFTYSRIGDQHTLTDGITSQTVTGTTDSFTIDEITESGNVVTGVIPYLKVYDSTDTLIHHWVCQSSKISNQDKIYDIVGGNHATLNGATLPFFTAEMDGSVFTDGGSTDVTDNVELITNGDFSTDTDWNKGDGWSISGGKASCVGSGNLFMVTPISVGIGETVLSAVVITDYVSGKARLGLSGSGPWSSEFSANDTYYFTGQLVGTLQVFIQPRDGDFVGSIELISVKHIPDAIIPADPDNLGYDIFGNPLTFTNILNAPADVVLVNAPESLEYWEADGALNKWLTTGGITISRDPYTLDENYNNQYFSGYTAVNNKEVMNYNEPIIGSCLIETKRYLDTVQLIVNDIGDQIQNDGGDDIVV